MAWIYLAESCTDSTSSQESEASQKPWLVTSSQLPTVKTTDTPRLYCSPECPQGICQLHPFGMTLLPCGGGHSLSSRKSSTEDSPVRTLALPDAEKAWTESEAAYFLRSQGSLAKYDPDSSTWKMCQLSGFEEPALSSRSWPASGMTVDGVCYPLQMWERITKENDGGYWRTPDTGAGGTSGLLKEGKTHRKSGAAITMRLVDQVNNQRFWPTPTVQDSENNGGGSQYKRNSIPLNALVKMFHTPKASGGGPDYAAKSRGKSANLPTDVGGSLNPVWVEWLMNYPSGWTALEPWAMQWFRPRRGKRLKD